MSIQNQVESCARNSCFSSSVPNLSPDEYDQLQNQTDAYVHSILALQEQNSQQTQNSVPQQTIVFTQEELEQQIKQIESLIQDLQNQDKNQYSFEIRNNIKGKTLQLQELQSIYDQKQKLLQTRNRMLQIAMEKNVYQRKYVYTLLSILLVIVLFMMVLYKYSLQK